MGEIFSVHEIKRNFKKRKRGRLLFWLRCKRKTPHDKDTFENARVLLLLVAASRKKGEEVELSESATTHFSHNSLTGDHHILIKNFQGVLTLSYWNPRHTIICEDAILWEQFTQNRYSRRSIKFQLFTRKKTPKIFWGRGGLGVFAFHDVPCRRFAPKFFVLKVHLFFTWRQVSRDPRRSSMGFYFIDSCAWTFRVVIIS